MGIQMQAESMGFRIVGDGADDSEWLMVADLALDRIRPRHSSAQGLERREEQYWRGKPT